MRARVRKVKVSTIRATSHLGLAHADRSPPAPRQKPAASTRTMVSRVAFVTPPSVPDVGEGART